MLLAQGAAVMLLWYIGAFFPAQLRRYPPTGMLHLLLIMLYILFYSLVIYALLWWRERPRKTQPTSPTLESESSPDPKV